MIFRKSFKNFTDEYLERYIDIVLQDVLHHIQAFLLFPQRDKYEDIRQRIILCLSLDYYNKASEDDPDRIEAIKILFQIPDDYSVRKHFGEAYPPWLIQKELTQKQEANHFKIVDRICWAYLRLAKSNLVFYKRYNASFNEVILFILGNTPLKTNAKLLKGEGYLCGEKAYGKHLNDYKPVCHFIMAFQYMGGDSDSFSRWTPDRIEHFLSLSLWFGNLLVEIETTNVKDHQIFPEDVLIPLPSWIDYEKINIPIEPYTEKRLEFEKKYEEGMADMARRYASQTS